VGLIITIAEGPNPFGFLFFASWPGFRLLGLIERVVRLPNLNAWLDSLLVVFVNSGIYFLAGWLLDAIIQRYRRLQRSAAH
jgi:hypothetical protein